MDLRLQILDFRFDIEGYGLRVRGFQIVDFRL